MIARAAGGALVALGAALAALPAFAWYAARAPGGRVSAAGLSGAGELWLLPVLGALAVLAGAALAATGEGVEAVARWAGPLALVAGAFGLVWSLRAGLDPRVALTVDERGGRRELSSPIDLEPAAVVTPVVAGALAVVGAAVAWAGWRAGARR